MPATAERSAPEKLPNGLTPRQARVLELLLAGQTRSEIARELSVVYQTVDGILETLAKKGALPASAYQGLPARFARWATAEPS